MRLTVDTEYPYARRSGCASRVAATSTLRVRVPGLGGAFAPRAAPEAQRPRAGRGAVPGSYASISRTWQSGDVVELTLPMDDDLACGTGQPGAQRAHLRTLGAGRPLRQRRPAGLILRSPTGVNAAAHRGRPGHDGRGGGPRQRIGFSPFLDVHHEHYNVYFLLPREGRLRSRGGGSSFDDLSSIPATRTGRRRASLAGGATRVARGSGSGGAARRGERSRRPAVGLLAGPLGADRVGMDPRRHPREQLPRLRPRLQREHLPVPQPAHGQQQGRLGDEARRHADRGLRRSAAGPLPVGEWTHIAATVGKEIRLYVGGVLVGATSPRTCHRSRSGRRRTTTLDGRRT